MGLITNFKSTTIVWAERIRSDPARILFPQQSKTINGKRYTKSSRVEEIGSDQSGKAYWRRSPKPGPELWTGVHAWVSTQSTDPPGVHEEASQYGAEGSLGSWDPLERAQGPLLPHQAAGMPSGGEISTTPHVPSSEQ